MTTEKHDALSGASRLTDVLCRTQKMRDETDAICHEDLMLADGTVLFNRNGHVAIRDEQDKLISLLKERLTQNHLPMATD